MRLNALNAIIRKEFRDQLGDGIVKIIFCIILVSTIIGILSGIVIYHQQMDNFNLMQDTGWPDIQDFKPHLTMILSPVAEILLVIGALFGVILGFDLVSKEREGNSLKILLSHPVFRDEIINGKAIGTMTILAGICLALFVIVIAVLLSGGIVPSGDEMIYLLIIGSGIFLMILAYFSLSLFFSTISDSSGNALLASLVVFIVLSSIVPYLATDMVISPQFMTLYLGQPPQLPGYTSMEPIVNRMFLAHGDVFNDYVWDRLQSADPYVASNYGERRITDEIWNRYQDEIQSWLENKKRVITIATLISPSENLRAILRTCGGLVPQSDKKNPFAPGDPRDLAVNFIAMVIYPALFLGLAYTRFLRMDIR